MERNAASGAALRSYVMVGTKFRPRLPTVQHTAVYPLNFHHK